MNRKTAQRLMKNPHYKTTQKEEREMFGGSFPVIHTGELKVPEEVKIVRPKRKYVRKAKKQESDKSESEQNNS